MRFLAAILALGASAAGGVAAGDSATPSAVKKILVSARCDACHHSGVSTDTPGALAVYDLREADWPARLSDARLPKLMGRLQGVPAKDRSVVQSFIAAELQRRAQKQ